MDILEALIKVLVVGMIFGAGLPALFAIGMRLHSDGTGETTSDGTITAPKPALRAVGYLFFAIVTAAIIVGLLWVTRQTLSYYFDWQIFPAGAYK